MGEERENPLMMETSKNERGGEGTHVLEEGVEDGLELSGPSTLWEVQLASHGCALSIRQLADGVLGRQISCHG